MDWILASCLMFISSVVLYLLLRKSQLRGISNTWNNIAMFSLPCALFLLYSVGAGLSLAVDYADLLVIVVAAVLFSYLGNVLSLASIGRSPNPGYSLTLSKSYVVYTTLAAMLLFGSHLSTQTAGGIILIVGFSALIVLSGASTQKKRAGEHWLAPAIGAFFCWGNLALVSKYILGKGIAAEVYLFYLCAFVSVCILIQIAMRREKPVLDRASAPLIASMGVAAALFNLFMQLGIATAPNPGYVNAINAGSISCVALFSAFLFGDELSLRKMLGIVGVMAGMMMLFL